MNNKRKYMLKLAGLFCMLLGLFMFCVQAQAATQYAKDGFYYEKEYGKVYIIGYYGTSSTMKVPAKIDGCTVVRIDSVKKTGEFGNTYASVEHIEMPDTVTVIGKEWSFISEKLKTVRLSAGLTSINGPAFAGCKNLESVTNTDGIEFLGYRAFADTALKSISFLNLKETDLEAFEECRNLVSINCPKLEKVDFDTFKDCPELKSVKLSPKLKLLNSGAFEGDRSLTSFKIPSTCKEVQNSCFAGTGLKTIAVPSTVTMLNHTAFQNCKNLESASLHIKGILHGYMFAGCTKLKTVDLGNAITELRWNVFKDCVSLKSVTIPHSVVKIDEDAFKGCENLTEIRGYRGTAAEKFAKSIGVKFTPVVPKITLSASSVKIYPVSGFNSTTLKVKREATSSTVKFKSSNTSVATVSSKGVITAKKAGSATITVTCGSLKKICKVVVAKPSVTLTSKKYVTLKVGQKTVVKAKTVPAAPIKFYSKNKDVAIVSSKGTVLAKKKGVCYIKAYIDGAYQYVKVTVK